MAFGGLISLVFYLLALGVLIWLVFWILDQFAVPEPIGKIIRIIVVVIAVLILISVLLDLAGVSTGVPRLR
jgi:hypothetical protein